MAGVARRRDADLHSRRSSIACNSCPAYAFETSGVYLDLNGQAVADQEFGKADGTQKTEKRAVLTGVLRPILTTTLSGRAP